MNTRGHTGKTASSNLICCEFEGRVKMALVTESLDKVDSFEEKTTCEY